MHNITFVNACALTEDTEDETVDEFFETLQSVCDELTKHDTIITLGDFNAKLGKEQIYKDITGRYSFHEVTNSNGLRLVQYATTNNFKVLSTWYPWKDIHKGTWKIPGTNDVNQIDHILVSKRWATDIENVRPYRGANSYSENFSVGARLKQRLALITRNRTENRERWKVDKFDETDVERYYQQEVQWKLQEKPPSNNKEEERTCIKKMLITSAQNIIG